MTMITQSRVSTPASSVLGRSARRVGEAVLASLQAVGRYVAAEVDRRRTAELLGYDDALLRDIGVTRADVYGALLAEAGERPSAELARRRDEQRAYARAQAREARPR
jgi:uncharacterized protein YjiS (DUF1127 family)